MSKIESFLKSYNQLDEFLRGKLKCDMSVSHSKLLTQMSKTDLVFSNLETKLQAYRALRNAIVHVHSEGETPIAVPNDEVVEDYQRIVNYAIKPPLAIDSIAIKNILTVEWTSSIKEVHEIMFNKGLSLIPIVKEERMVGIFSSWHLQKYLIDNNLNVHHNTKLSDLYVYLNIERPLNDLHAEFRIDFQKITANIDDIIRCYTDSALAGHYFKAVYLTQNGNPLEKIEGVITPHCLPTINPNLLNKTLAR